MSQEPATASIPQVFVLWHRDYQHGERIARSILQWLRPGNGFGPEVFYRSLPEPGRMRLPPPLPDPSPSSSAKRLSGQQRVCNLQIVVVLAEANMVSDWSWRHWLEDLAKTRKDREIMPVALDATAYNMPGTLRQLNYLRPTDPRRAGESALDDAAFEVLVRSLLKQLTEAMCRRILPRSTEPKKEGAQQQQQPQPTGPAQAGNAPPPKVNVFLSHAKQDGTGPARRLRDYIYSQTQLAAFFDENDIAFGDVFASVIQGRLDSSDTAAMIVVRSAAYASRPWCRRELSLFRKPRPEPPAAGRPEQWRLYPSLIVEAMEGRELSMSIPEIGNSRVIRWTDNDPGLVELIVSTVIRDAMLASFHSALGASIPAGDGKAKQIVINWLPDPTTLLMIDAVRSGQECQVFHPGRGLPGLELEILDEFFPRVTFRSFEEALLW